MNPKENETANAVNEIKAMFQNVPKEVRDSLLTETQPPPFNTNLMDSLWTAAFEHVNSIIPVPSQRNRKFLIGAWNAFLTSQQAPSEPLVESHLMAAVDVLADVDNVELRDSVLAEWFEFAPKLADQLRCAIERIGLTSSNNEIEPTDEDQIVLPPAKPRWQKWLAKPASLVGLGAAILVGIAVTQHLMKPGNDRNEPSIATGDHDELHEDFPFVEPRPANAGSRETLVYIGDEYRLDVIKDSFAARSNYRQSVLFLIDKELVKNIAWTNNGELVFADWFQTSAGAREVESMEVFLLISSKEPCNALSVFKDQDSTERIQEFLKSEMTRQTPGQFARELLKQQYDPQTMTCDLWRAKHVFRLRPSDPPESEPTSR
jgi:hypothetical protein